MLGLAARLPDPLVGVRPGGDRGLHLFSDQFAIGRRAAAAQRFFVQVDRVEQRPPDVVLALVEGAVAGPHRTSAAVAAEVVEGPLGQLLLAADPVHDLQVRVLAADVEHEAHEVARLLVEAERVQGPEAEGRVADPAEAVVPVAFPAGRLRQRGGRRGEDRPGRRVGEALEDEGRALQVDAPGMVGEFAVAQPVAPELFGRVEPLQRLGGAARPAEVAVAPGDGAEPGLVLAQPQRPAGAAPDRELHVTGQAQLGAVDAAGHRLSQLAAAPVRWLRRRSRSAAGTPSPPRPRRRCRSSSAAASDRTRARCRAGRPCRPLVAHSAIVSASWTTTQPVGVTQVVSITSVPGL